LSVSKYSFSRSTKGNLQKKEVYYRDAAKLYKEKIIVPLILVGGIRSYKIAQELIEKDQADYISLSRPLIREANLIKRWQLGDTRKATCISCNQCFIPTRAGEGLYCVLKK
jgi:2,4-dienoyl-CoA reductase-like NADH-dependent reductase (Old Yellow Enzyme family)